jgi:hypothetical protein
VAGVIDCAHKPQAGRIVWCLPTCFGHEILHCECDLLEGCAFDWTASQITVCTQLDVLVHSSSAFYEVTEGILDGAEALIFVMNACSEVRCPWLYTFSCSPA